MSDKNDENEAIGVLSDIEANSLYNSGEVQRGSGRRASIKSTEVHLSSIAYKVAAIQIVANNLALLDISWATIVLLGGFSSSLKLIDFWYVTIIIFEQGSRIYYRKNVGLTVNHSKLLLPSTVRNQSHMKTESWYTFHFHHLTKFVIASLSLHRIIKGDYLHGHVSGNATDGQKNLKSALILFYIVILFEVAIVFSLLVYVAFKVNKNLFVKMDKRLGFNPNKDSQGFFYVEHYFYYVYSQFMGVRWIYKEKGDLSDMFNYARKMLLSKDLDKVSRGATILCKLISDEDYTNKKVTQLDMMFSIDTNDFTIEMLIEMLGWENKEFRTFAAKIVLEVACKAHYTHRLINTSNCLELVSSLLSNKGIVDEHNINLSVLGLDILVKISNRDENVRMVGNTCGLLSKIIKFIDIDKTLLTEVSSPTIFIEAIHLALTMLWKLAKTEGQTGSFMRCEMLKNIFIASNLKLIIQHTTENNQLRNNAIDIVKYLSMEGKQARNQVGRTGGIIEAIVSLYIYDNNEKASEALFFLSLDHQKNCQRMLSKDSQAFSLRSLQQTNNCHDMVKRGDMTCKLLCMLQLDENLGSTTNTNIIYSVNILRNIIMYGNLNQDYKEHIINFALPIVSDQIIKIEKEDLLQSFLGLAVAVFQANGFQKIEPHVGNLVTTRLVQLIKNYVQPSTIVPNIRRYVIELVSLIMESHRQSIERFISLGLYNALQNVLETTSELESFYMLSGSICLNEYKTDMHDLVESVINQLSGSS